MTQRQKCKVLNLIRKGYRVLAKPRSGQPVVLRLGDLLQVVTFDGRNMVMKG